MTVSETAQTTDWILQPVNISIKIFNKDTIQPCSLSGCGTAGFEDDHAHEGISAFSMLIYVLIYTLRTDSQPPELQGCIVSFCRFLVKSVAALFRYIFSSQTPPFSYYRGVYISFCDCVKYPEHNDIFL